MSDFTNLMAAEWIKMRSLRSMRWGMALSAAGILWMNVNAALADASNYKKGDRSSPVDGQHEIFTNNSHLVVLMVFGALGAILMVGEYSTGLIRGTFAAVPDRNAVVAAKIVVATLAATVAGLVVVAASYACTQAIIAGDYGALSPTTHGLPMFLAASVLLFPLSALVGLGIGTLIRNSASTIVAVVTILMLVPNFLVSRIHAWINDLHNATPFAAWQRLDGGHGHPAAPGVFADPTVGGAWTVYAVWAVVPVLIAFALVRKRDV
ncbi:ABC-2 type transport system permease protein [Catenulispora sp. MAP12-49]|uniref:ABC transporter permease n=1 Tax=unclassified Catenulispora TaxID=414885 RepID=UPI003518B9E1